MLVKERGSKRLLCVISRVQSEIYWLPLFVCTMMLYMSKFKRERMLSSKLKYISIQFSTKKIRRYSIAIKVVCDIPEISCHLKGFNTSCMFHGRVGN